MRTAMETVTSPMVVDQLKTDMIAGYILPMVINSEACNSKGKIDHNSQEKSIKKGVTAIGHPLWLGGMWITTIGLVNGNLFGLVLLGFGDVDLQQTIFVFRFDIICIDIAGQGEASFEPAVGSFFAIVVIFLDFAVSGSFAFEGQNPVFDIHDDVVFIDTWQFRLHDDVIVFIIDIDLRVPVPERFIVIDFTHGHKKIIQQTVPARPQTKHISHGIPSYKFHNNTSC